MSPDRPKRVVFRDGAIIGITQAITLILAVLALTLLLGNQQQQALNDIRDSNRAISCVLTLPVTDNGRNEGEVNGICLIPNHLAPIDANHDGVINMGPATHG